MNLFARRVCYLNLSLKQYSFASVSLLRCSLSAVCLLWLCVACARCRSAQMKGVAVEGNGGYGVSAWDKGVIQLEGCSVTGNAKGDMRKSGLQRQSGRAFERSDGQHRDGRRCRDRSCQSRAGVITGPHLGAPSTAE